jgi:cation transporter-like permease
MASDKQQQTHVARTPNATPELPIYTDVDKVPLPLLEQMSGHWLAMYMSQKRQHDVSIKHIIWSQLLTVIVLGTAGIYLQQDRQALLLFGGALIVYPAISGVFSSNAAALSATIHHEMDDSGMMNRRMIVFMLRSLLQAIAVSLIASIIVGLLSAILATWFFHSAFLPTFKLAVFVAAATGIVGMPIAVMLVLLIRRLQSNPDDVAGPTTNTVFSFLPLVFIIIFSRLLA